MTPALKRRLAATAMLVAAGLSGSADAAKLSKKSEASIVKLLDVVATGDKVGEVQFGELANGAVASVSFQGDRGEGYYFNVICDDDCLNVDLAVIDAAGVALDLDEADDNAPVVNVISEFDEKGLRPLTIEVRMKSCKAATCAYGLRISKTD
jgi:hypothetical protein